MRAGALKQPIIIQEPVNLDSNYGDIQAWVKHAIVRASVEPLSGKRYFEANQYNHHISTQIRIRFLSSITNKMRVIYQDKTLEIISIVNVREENKELLILCSEVTQ